MGGVKSSYAESIVYIWRFTRMFENIVFKTIVTLSILIMCVK